MLERRGAINELREALESYEATQRDLNTATIYVYDSLNNFKPFLVDNFDAWHEDDKQLLTDAASKYEEAPTPHNLYWLASTMHKLANR